MERLFRFSAASRRDAAVDAWFDARPGKSGSLARHWFEVIRACGDDVREVLHDGQPTACVDEAAFAYVDAFSAHVNLGFFHGNDLPDPAALVQGAGARGRRRSAASIDRGRVWRHAGAAADGLIFVQRGRLQAARQRAGGLFAAAARP